MTSSGKEGCFIRNADEMVKVEAQAAKSQVSVCRVSLGLGNCCESISWRQ